MMKKPTLDEVLVRSMLNDFQRFLATLEFEKIWTETLEADPNFPITRARAGWRGTESGNNGSQESWKQIVCIVLERICTEFSNQISWRFQNLEKFTWMDLVHPSKLTQSRKLPSNEVKLML